MKPFAKTNIAAALLLAGSLAASADPFEDVTESSTPDVLAIQADASLDSAACVAAGGDVINGTSIETRQSADATAFKSLTDPNNQLGTSLQGNTPGPVNCVMTASAAPSSNTSLE